jgi:hypothetical protein
MRDDMTAVVAAHALSVAVCLRGFAQRMCLLWLLQRHIARPYER